MWSLFNDKTLRVLIMAGAQCSNYDSETTVVKLCRHLDLTFFWFMLRL